jgi:hypothetical protein
LVQLRRARQGLENELMMLTHQPLVGGSLIAKYKRCNKGNCRCTRGELHGPFWYLSQTIQGRTVMHFIRAAEVARVRPAYLRTKQWRQRRAQLVRLGTRMLQLLDRLAEQATVGLETLEHRRR